MCHTSIVWKKTIVMEMRKSLSFSFFTSFICITFVDIIKNIRFPSKKAKRYRIKVSHRFIGLRKIVFLFQWQIRLRRQIIQSYERNCSRRRFRHTLVSHHKGYQQTVNPDFRQTDGLLPFVGAHAGRYPRYSHHFHTAGSAGL